MAYQVIARKFRPQAFGDIVGQAHVVKTLSNAIKKERIPHAFLFTGIRGVGKTSAARVLAKALNCINGPTETPCNECEHCKAITQGNHLDVLEIDAASNRGIDEIRELREKINYLPSRTQYKVYIIDEVHMLTTEAFNALLKTLEEPPAHAKFILATTEINKIPITILSRCQRFDFKRIPLPAMVARLGEICEREGVGADPKDLMTIAKASGGSMRDAQSILDQIISMADGKILSEDIQNLLGVYDQAVVISLVDAILARDFAKAHACIASIHEAGHELIRFALDTATFLKDLMLTMRTPALAAQLDRSEEELQQLARLRTLRSLEDVELITSVFVRGYQQMLRTEDPRLLLEVLCYRTTFVANAMPIDAVLAQLGNLEKKKL